MLQPIVHENNPVDWIINVTYGGNSYQVEMADNPDDIEVYQIKDELISVEVPKCSSVYDVLRAAASRYYFNK